MCCGSRRVGLGHQITLRLCCKLADTIWVGKSFVSSNFVLCFYSLQSLPEAIFDLNLGFWTPTQVFTTWLSSAHTHSMTISSGNWCYCRPRSPVSSLLFWEARCHSCHLGIEVTGGNMYLLSSVGQMEILWCFSCRAQCQQVELDRWLSVIGWVIKLPETFTVSSVPVMSGHHSCVLTVSIFSFICCLIPNQS